MKLGLHLALALSFSSLTIYCSSSDSADDDGSAGLNGNEAGGGTGGQQATGGSGGGSVGGSSSTGGTSEGGTGGEPDNQGVDGGNVDDPDASTGGTSTGGTGGAPTETGPIPSSGCDAADPAEQQETWLPNDITVAGLPEDQADQAQRQYFVRLPIGYDHTQAYPVVFYGPGCGASMVEPTPMMGAVASDAIHVFLLQKDGCFSTGYPSPEVPYFTQALDAIQAKYCTDTKRVFVSGYSSGGWLSNVLACALGDRIRGIGTAAGGLRKATIDGYGCDPAAEGTPKVSGILYSGENDTENPAVRLDDNGFNYGVEGARDRLIQANGCDPDVHEVWQNSFGADFCQIWKTGCEANPVVYCVGPGDGHGNGTKGGVSNIGFWEFWSSLPEEK
jgi:poly(3-hydroxybutyrate) depolymerase